MKRIAVITPIIFEGYLIICLDIKWLDLFGKLPTFTCQVVENCLRITSEEIRSHEKKQR